METDPQQPIEPSQPITEAELADLTATAFHEAGHAVMAIIVGRTIQKVNIAQANIATGGKRLGVCKMKKGRSKPTKDWLEDEVLIMFAGMVAESHFTGQYCPLSAGTDLRAVVSLLSQSRATTERQLQKVQRRLLDKTEHLLSEDENVKAIELIAAELIAKQTISGRAVLHFYNMANAGR